MASHIAPHIIAEDLLERSIQHIQAHALPQDFDNAIDILQKTHGKIILCGIGKSGHIARKINATLQSLCIPSVFLHAGEASHGDLGVMHKTDCLLLLSHSGKSQESISVWMHATQLGIPRIIITSDTTTPLARSADAVLDYLPGELCQWSRVPTLSTQMMLLWGDLLCMLLQSNTSIQEDDYLLHHPSGAHGYDAQRIDALYEPLKDIPSVTPSTSILDTMKKIHNYHKGYAVVIDAKNTLSGIFTDGDLRRALLKHAALHDAVQLWMTPTPITLRPDMTLSTVKQLFLIHKITAAPVIDAKSTVLGMIDHSHISTLL